MGVDWIKVKNWDRLHSDRVEELIKQQHDNFPLFNEENEVSDLIGAYISEKEPVKYRDNKKYRIAKEALKIELQLPEDLYSLEIQDLFRTMVVSNHTIFPIEWRIEAHSSFSHTRLTEALTKWKEYISDVKDGKHQKYLHEILFYKNQLALDQSNQWLKSNLKKSYELTNAWTKKEKFLIIRDELENNLNLDFDLPSIPVFDMHQINSSFEENKIQLKEQFKKKEQLVRQLKQWNRVVASKWKIWLPQTQNMDDFIKNGIDDDWLSKFFDWCETVIEEKGGLYLWY